MKRFLGTVDRFELWERVLADRQPETVAEIGVFRGTFAARALAATSAIKTYYMVDPWRHLDDWNKPANKSDEVFAELYAEAMRVTDFAADKRVVLRGTTQTESPKIPDESLDFAYIDGDHTLRGITIDLVRLWPKMKPGGLLCGDDLSPTIWQHGDEFEPTFVFPLAAHFAEAVGATMWALEHQQFAIDVPRSATQSAGQFIDLVGSYPQTTVRTAMLRGRRT